MKRFALELFGFLIGIGGVLYLTGWDDTAPLYAIVVFSALMLMRWIDAWSSGRRRSQNGSD